MLSRTAGIAMLTAGLCFTNDLLLLTVALSFENGCTDRNADSCVNIVDEKIFVPKNLVNFGQGTLP